MENTEILLNAIRNNQCAEVVLELLEGGVDWTLKDSEGDSLLGCAACYSTNPEVISALIEAGAELDEVNKDGWTPLMFAAVGNTNHEVISVLIEAGANVDKEIKAQHEIGYSQDGCNTALELAASYNTNPKVISALIEAGANLDEDDLSDLLDRAASYNTNPKVISMLARATELARGCSNARFESADAGERLLECVSDINGNRELIDALMEAGAFVTREDLELFSEDQELYKSLCNRPSIASFRIIGDTVYYYDGHRAPAPRLPHHRKIDPKEEA